MKNDTSFEAVLETFAYLKSINDPVRQEFETVKAAKRNKLPISSFKKMFGAWLFQKKGGQ